MLPLEGSLRASELEAEVVSLYQERAAGLLRYAESLSRDTDQARDAVQETFLRYFVERSYGRQIEHPRAWLYEVLRNHMLERLKSVALRQEVLAEDLDQLPDLNYDPEISLRRNELAQQIAAVLTDREFDCLRLRTEGLSYTEIADVMDIRPGTVGALLARAHTKMRQATGREPAPGAAEAARILLQEA